MHKVSFYSLFLFLISGFYSCQLKPKEVVENNIDSTTVSTEELTMTGVIEDASMNNFILITSAGDTVCISTMDQDPKEVSGFNLGDTVKVDYIQEESEPGVNTIPTAKKVVVMGKGHQKTK